MKFCNTNLKSYTFPLATAVCLALSGCGGGDDSSTAAATASTDTLTAVVITEANMADIAAAVIMSTTASDLGASDSASPSNLVLGVETTAKPPGSIPSPVGGMTELVVQEVKAASSLDAQALVVGVESSPSSQCYIDGTKTYTYDRQDPSGTFIAGDRVKVSFSACDDGVHVLNGDIQMTVNSLSGFEDPFNPVGSMDVSAVFTNLVASAGQTSLTMNGGMNVAATITDPDNSTTTMQASSINYVVERNGSRMAMTLKNLNQHEAEYADRFELSVSEDFSASFPTFSGSGRVTTLVPVVTYFNVGTTGQLKVAGQNSALYITFQSGDSVYLGLDRDNDGTPEVSVNTTLAELDLLNDLF
jgi:hypothetical protein